MKLPRPIEVEAQGDWDAPAMRDAYRRGVIRAYEIIRDEIITRTEAFDVVDEWDKIEALDEVVDAINETIAPVTITTLG